MALEPKPWGTTQCRIDHIIIACKDCEVAAKHIFTEYGFQAYAGGRHQGWGTENWLVPVGGAYLELAAVFDNEVAESCDWGKLIKAKIKEAGDKPWILVTWAVELPEGALAIAERLGGESKPMLRIRPDGQHLTWRVGCMSRFTEPGRHPKPFFITWDSPDMRPDKTEVRHTVEPSGIAFVDVSGDKAAMDKWLGPTASSELRAQIQWSDGPLGLKSVGIKTPTGVTVMLSP